MAWPELLTGPPTTSHHNFGDYEEPLHKVIDINREMVASNVAISRPWQCAVRCLILEYFKVDPIPSGRNSIGASLSRMHSELGSIAIHPRVLNGPRE